jgi:hypothetical protein
MATTPTNKTGDIDMKNEIKTAWTESEVKKAASAALDMRGGIVAEIEEIAADNQYTNWIITIDSNGNMDSTSSLYDLADDAIILSDEPDDFLRNLGWLENEDGDYVFDTDDTRGPVESDIIYHIQRAYLDK